MVVFDLSREIESKCVQFDTVTSQKTFGAKHKVVKLRLDHMNEAVYTGKETVKDLCSSASTGLQLGSSISFTLTNEISTLELELYKFCKERMKKKDFESIVLRASQLLKEHPNSLWANFFFGVACKRIPKKEHLFVSALTHTVTVNPNFLSGWQALHKHFLGLGGFFSKQSHNEMYVVVKVLLRIEPNYTNWCLLVGQIWDFVTANCLSENKMLSLITPYLNCNCRDRKTVVANFLVNFVRTTKKLLPNSFSTDMLKSFQILMTVNNVESYRLGVFYAALRYFNRTEDIKLICVFIRYIYVNDILQWNLPSAREFAFNLVYEIFKTLGQNAMEAIEILKFACGEGIAKNSRNVICGVILTLTFTVNSLLENVHKVRDNELMGARVLYLKTLTHLGLHQEAFEQVLEDLNAKPVTSALEKDYLSIIIGILGRTRDACLQRFALRLAYKYLKTYGVTTNVLHNVCLINISLGDFVTASRILKSLASYGALKDVVYLQALLHKEENIQLDFLKSLDNIADAHLRSAYVYMKIGNSKRLLKSMLEASFYFHVGIRPFEWLGIYYFERDLCEKATRYLLEAFSNNLVSCVAVNYISSIYGKQQDFSKLQTLYDTLDSKTTTPMDVLRCINLKSGLMYLNNPKSAIDFHKAVEKFRKVADCGFGRNIIELIADSLSNYGMHGCASEFYMMCHAERAKLHIYPSIMYGCENKMIKHRGHNYVTTLRNVVGKANNSLFALYNYGCVTFDQALASYGVNNGSHCMFLCQQAVLMLTRCIATCSNVSIFWTTVGNVLFTISSLHADFASVYVPSWLMSQNGGNHSMSLIKKHDAFILALRCYSIGLKTCQDPNIFKLILFYIGVTFRHAKTFYKEEGSRLLQWALTYALESCDLQCWQRNNLCGVVLTDLDKYEDALLFFKDAITIGNNQNPKDAEFNMGISYLRLGEFTKAHEIFMSRRGGDPMDCLVWRSYMLLHRCLNDNDTIMHYLWYLLYSIKHYPSLGDGMECLELINNSVCVEKLDNNDGLQKKCLLYTILSSPLFIKMCFVGDWEVPHKLNEVSASNYFQHGAYNSYVEGRVETEDNFHNFLKLISEYGSLDNNSIDYSLFNLGMNGSNQWTTMHDLLHFNKNQGIAFQKFYIGLCCDQSAAISELIGKTTELETDVEAWPLLFPLMRNADGSTPSSLGASFVEFHGRMLSLELLKKSFSLFQSTFPRGNIHEVNKIISDLFKILHCDESSVNTIGIISSLEKYVRSLQIA